MKQPIFLIGYMAAGKTSLGRFASKRLGREFIDLDKYIEARYRQSVSDLFATRGEEAFRIIERNMLHEVGEFDNVLIATGGGTPCFFDNMAYMNERGVAVFLTCFFRGTALTTVFRWFPNCIWVELNIQQAVFCAVAWQCLYSFSLTIH